MILDLAAGAGGWDEGLEALGRIDVVGIEIDPHVVRTAELAGHFRLQGDMTTMDPFAVARHIGAVEGIVASPPCQTFSRNGWGQGRPKLGALREAVNGFRHGRAVTHAELTVAVEDERTATALEPLRYIQALEPTWVALEQVPPVLILWQAIAHLLREWGYSVWCGKVHAEQFGVPQARERAIVLAHRERLATPPAPTHSRFYSYDPPRLDVGVKPWVTMGEALGWDEIPLLLPDGSPRLRDASGTPIDTSWVARRPATTMVGRELLPHPGASANASNGATKSRNDGVKVTHAEASVLQTFRPDYPWQGGKQLKFLQIGNAVPPLLAQALLGQLL